MTGFLPPCEVLWDLVVAVFSWFSFHSAATYFILLLHASVSNNFKCLWKAELTWYIGFTVRAKRPSRRESWKGFLQVKWLNPLQMLAEINFVFKRPSTPLLLESLQTSEAAGKMNWCSLYDWYWIIIIIYSISLICKNKSRYKL